MTSDADRSVIDSPPMDVEFRVWPLHAAGLDMQVAIWKAIRPRAYVINDESQAPKIPSFLS